MYVIFKTARKISCWCEKPSDLNLMFTPIVIYKLIIWSFVYKCENSVTKEEWKSRTVGVSYPTLIFFYYCLLMEAGDLGNWSVSPCDWVFRCCNSGFVFHRFPGLMSITVHPGFKKMLMNNINNSIFCVEPWAVSPFSRASGIQQWWLKGLAAPWHVASSGTRDRTGVCCIARRILSQWTTREAQAVGSEYKC